VIQVKSVNIFTFVLTTCKCTCIYPDLEDVDDYFFNIFFIASVPAQALVTMFDYIEVSVGIGPESVIILHMTDFGPLPKLTYM